MFVSVTVYNALITIILVCTSILVAVCSHFDCDTPEYPGLVYTDLSSGEIVTTGQKLKHFHVYHYHCQNGSRVSFRYDFLECALEEIYGVLSGNMEFLDKETWPYCMDYFKLITEDDWTYLEAGSLHRNLPFCRDESCMLSPAMWPLNTLSARLIRWPLGSTVPLRCWHDWVIQGDAYLECLEGRVYFTLSQGSHPNCTGVVTGSVCQQPLQNGVMYWPGWYAQGSITSLACKPPSVAKGALLQCMPGGVWSPVGGDQWPVCSQSERSPRA